MNSGPRTYLDFKNVGAYRRSLSIPRINFLFSMQYRGGQLNKSAVPRRRHNPFSTLSLLCLNFQSVPLLQSGHLGGIMT